MGGQQPTRNIFCIYLPIPMVSMRLSFVVDGLNRMVRARSNLFRRRLLPLCNLVEAIMLVVGIDPRHGRWLISTQLAHE